MRENTDINIGLSSQQVEQRVVDGLVNGEFNIKSKSIKQIVKDNCLTFFNLINVILAVFIIAVGSIKNCLFMGVIISNTAIGIFQEIRSKKAIDKLSLISAPKVDVLRNSIVEIIAVKDVVMDDIVILGAGKQICADCIIAQGECEVNESLITGESDPVVKKVGDEILSGSFIVCGDVKAQVIRIGAESYANKITSGAKYVKKNNSEMLHSINYILKIISICIIPMTMLFFAKEMIISNATFEEAVIKTVAAIIGIIPEGLVLMASMVLAVSVIRLAVNKTLAQDLYCIETLARVDVLCLDKTGTITEGIMQVDDVIPLADNHNIDSALTALMTALHDNNPTFNAIKSRYSGESDWATSVAIPFSSAKKWSLAAFEGKGTYIIGAAEFVLGEKFEAIRELVETASMQGQRVLLLAHSENMPVEKELPDEIIPIALIQISDKIRKEAPDTLKFFAEQGVDIRVISGDNPITVSNIAKKAGLANADSYVDASTLKTLDDIADAADRYKIFGRVTPYQKLELVKALKAKKHTVAMTGDGVNDVLALKESDCSIAMQSGSDAARNVSNLVLLDSNFASMPKIVAEGRRSINNIQRSGILFLNKTVYSFIVAIMFCFVPMSYPFQAIQLTLINMFTNGIPSFLLALEPNYERVKGKFIENVMPMSVIHGLLIVVNFIGLIVCNYVMKTLNTIPPEILDSQMGTIATITIGFSAFVVLFKVCRPMKKWKAGMLALLICGFTGGMFLFRGLLDIENITVPMIISILALVGATIIVATTSCLYEKKLVQLILNTQRRIKAFMDRHSRKANSK